MSWIPTGFEAERSMVVSGLVHRYPDRVLFLTTDRCGSYCRYCTRSRLVSNAQGYSFHPNFEKNLDSIDLVNDYLINKFDKDFIYYEIIIIIIFQM